MQQTLDFEIGKEIKAEVFHNISSKELGKKQQIVLNCLKNNPDGLTDKGIAVQTNLSLSCVNGRRNELMHMGLVIPITIHVYQSDDGSNLIPNVVWGVKIT